MDCNCGLPAHFFVGRDGKIGYNCPRSKCKFYATAPVFCSEYSRIVPNASTPADAILIRCEAALHPEAKGGRSVPCCLLKCYGSITDRPDLLAVLEDPAYGGEWHTTAAAYIYLMEHYKTLVSRLKSMKSTLLQEIPPFFFSCLEKYRQATVQYEYLLHNDKEKDELEMDVVYQQLKPFQKKGVEFILTRGGRGMIADSMGLGKTVQAICVAHYYRQEWPVLVVCPMSLTENWVKEFNRFCGVAFSRMIVLQGPKAQVTSLHEVVIVSYSSLKYVDKKVFNVVILDESHYIKAGDSNRTKAALSLCSKANRVLLLSGTPAMSRPIELYTQMQAIQARCTPTKTQFGARYCNAFVGRFGVDYTGHMHENELHYFLRNFMIRRTKAELGGELPSKTRQLLYVTITEKERKAMEKQVSALRKSVDSAPGGATSTVPTREM
ncbi:hypothetical protein AGDE_13483 [Angomonas deanei]|uniref:Type III restriction enzyme, res subunit/SNF2 family N-terminal domain containing protein, putative n=1 Tax=Angomonas deanei TaxID=59799 RepID=A0A7G2CJ96_9TRYP|nr:hypothetical protein AGDE_13483 [Angomonas deanei]CAD2219928.1 Type III restriction enzyme, res subunit/SNF2 family N-terminal domain containing protein, putative [Angomonas deanei]|eukprot:EPY22303.1 hypothetical protein AGDE_13483 [Angomonas deanei]